MSKRISQSKMPKNSLKSSIEVARVLFEEFGGEPTPPHLVADAVGYSPTSSTWRNLSGSAVAYGLTTGGYGAKEIKLTDLGRKIVAPTKEGEDDKAVIEALINPQIPKKFFERYDGSKFPKEKIGTNVLVEWGLPKKRSEEAIKILKESGVYSKVITDSKTGLFVALDAAKRIKNRESENDIIDDSEDVESEDSDFDKESFKQEREDAELRLKKPGLTDKLESVKSKIFISHGKDKSFVETLKGLLEYGELEPVVAVEDHTSSKPLSEKVIGAMRRCGGAIIHLERESVSEKRKDDYKIINENVLTELGAALVLYGSRIILLVKEGVELPSNVKGLFQVRYSGDKLDGDDTLKLLDAIKDMKKQDLPERYLDNGE